MFFVMLTVWLNYLEFTVAVSMKQPWLGVAKGGDTETNKKHGNYSFGVLYTLMTIKRHESMIFS